MRDVVARALSAQRQETLAFLRGLTDADWELPCLPPWRVREVVAHLVAIDEAAVTGRLLPVLRSHGRAEIEWWNEAAIAPLADATTQELLERLERSGARLAAVVSRLPRVSARIPVRTAFGRHPLYVLVCRRVVDEWVHSVDLADATGGRAAVAGSVPAALATGVLDILPDLVLPRLDVRAGVVRLVVTVQPQAGAHGDRRTWGIDFARRQYGTRVTARPDAVVRLHATTLALLAEGRRRWRDGPRPDVEVEGDEALARRVLEGLAP